MRHLRKDDAAERAGYAASNRGGGVGGAWGSKGTRAVVSVVARSVAWRRTGSPMQGGSKPGGSAAPREARPWSSQEPRTAWVSGSREVSPLRARSHSGQPQVPAFMPQAQACSGSMPRARATPPNAGPKTTGTNARTMRAAAARSATLREMRESVCRIATRDPTLHVVVSAGVPGKARHRRTSCESLMRPPCAVMRSSALADSKRATDEPS